MSNKTRRKSNTVNSQSPDTVSTDEFPSNISPVGVSAENAQLDEVPALTINTASTSSSIQTESTVLPNDPDYIPLVFELPITPSDPDIFEIKNNIQITSNIDYPLFSFGFHHYIHFNKNKMEILKEFEGKKKVYHVMNKFERYVDNYPDDIGHYSEKYFQISGKKPPILNREFYKLWEMLFMFNLVDLDKKNFVSAHIAEGPGSFIQATMFFRDKFSKNSKNDKYYAITLHKEDEDGHVQEIDPALISYYSSEKPQRLIVHKTYPKQVAGGFINKDNGDVTNPKTINLFGGQMGKDRADLITADGGFDWTNENIQEQEAFRLIIAQIYTAFTVQAKDGNFVCKFFETFTDTSVKLIHLLTQMYNEIYLTKPLTSRASNSEKYIVCIGFRYNTNDPQYKRIIFELSDAINKLHEQPDMKLTEIWPELNLPNDFKLSMIYCNTYIANRQLKSINEITSFITAQNYYGDVYQMRRQMQIDANKYWISMFLPNDKQFNEVLEEVREITDAIVLKNSNPKILPKISIS